MFFFSSLQVVFRTVGYSGADIRNLVNEAGIMSVSLFLMILVSAHVYSVFVCISCEGVTYTYIRPWKEKLKMKIKHFILFFEFVHFPFSIRGLC